MQREASEHKAPVVVPVEVEAWVVAHPVDLDRNGLVEEPIVTKAEGFHNGYQLAAAGAVAAAAGQVALDYTDSGR